MTLAEQILADDSIFYNTDEFAEVITYAGVGIDAHVEYGEKIESPDGSIYYTAVLTAKIADVPTATYRDVVVIDSVTWYVSHEESTRRNQYDNEIALSRDERPKL